MPNTPKRYSPSNMEKPTRKPWQDNHAKGSRHERGYDYAWVKLRNAYIKKNPLCEPCQRSDHVTPATQVDHIVSFREKQDILRLHPCNLQSICDVCHTIKTSNPFRHYQLAIPEFGVTSFQLSQIQQIVKCDPLIRRYKSRDVRDLLEWATQIAGSFVLIPVER